MLPPISRRLVACAVLLIFAAASARAQISIAAQGGNTTASYNGTTSSNIVFTNITVQAGDVLVIGHSNNKNNNGSNTITAGMTGISDSFITVAAPSSTGQAGAWLFYTPISTSGTISSITLDTNSSTKTVAQASYYYVLRGGAGQTLSIGNSQSDAGAGGTSKTLNFTFNSNNVDYFAITATATGTIASVNNPAGWTESIAANNKREIYYLDSSTAGESSLSVTSTLTVADVQAFAGLVVISSVPEPSTYAALFGVASLGYLLVQRRKSRAKLPRS